MKSNDARLRAGTLGELAEKGHIVLAAADRPVVVFHNDGDICAVDNRCPHLGFPLHQGGCKDGLIICPWHHARFEAHSGCTFDLFAGDVEPFDVTVENDEVFVSAYPRPRDAEADARRRLREGMETNNSLVIAKAVLAMRGAKVPPVAIVREAALFGVAHRDSWEGGLTSLTALANLLPHLSDETAFLALYQGVRRVAADCAGQTSRRERYALETNEVPAAKLKEWLASWITVRHRDAAERTLLTAVQNGLAPAEIMELFCTAALGRVYADGGHIVDFANKAFELLDLIGWEQARPVLPTLMARTAAVRGAEEQNNWRQPIDLIPLLERCNEELPELFASGAGKVWTGEAGLAAQILGDEPGAIADAIGGAIRAGATPEQLAKAVTYAAAVRVARFSAANEIGDWFTALHTFSYCHAMHQVLRQCPRTELVRGVLQGAFSIYQDRYLNVPPARLPKPNAAWPQDGAGIRRLLLDALDQRGRDETAAGLVAHYLELDHPIEPLIDSLTYAVVREDADFHTIQMVEAGVREYFEWGSGEEGRTILVAVARYLAAFSPTQRAQLQTATIALRLYRGEKLYEDDDGAGR